MMLKRSVAVHPSLAKFGMSSNIQLFWERLSEKGTKVHETRPRGGLGIHWNLAHWPRRNKQVCIFARDQFVFPLRRPLSVALLLLSHVFEWAKFF